MVEPGDVGAAHAATVKLASSPVCFAGSCHISSGALRAWIWAIFAVHICSQRHCLVQNKALSSEKPLNLV